MKRVLITVAAILIVAINPLSFQKANNNDNNNKNQQQSRQSNKGGINHDLNTRVDVSFRNQAAITRDIASGVSSASSGNQALKISFSALILIQ